MHVLYLIDSVGTPGGAERSLALLAPEYARLGVRLTVAVLHDRPGHREAIESTGASVVVLDGNQRVAWFRAAVGLLRDLRPDLVHTTLFDSDVIGRVAGRLTRVPVVSSIVTESYGRDHFGDPSVSQLTLRGAWALDVATARLAIRMHAVSRHVADVMARRLRFPRARIDVVPRGRDPVALGTCTEDRRARVRSELGLDDRARAVLAIGRQEHPKGFDVLVRATAGLRSSDAVVLVAGRAGSQTAELERLVTSLGLERRVRFLGNRDDVADLLCAADLFAMPSRREGSPGALLEAMALGTPAVVSDLPQVREVVDESIAWLVPRDEPGAWSRTIDAALGDAEGARRRRGLGSKRFEARYSIGEVGEQMVEFYERTLTWAAGSHE